MKEYIRPTFAVVEIDLNQLMITESLTIVNGTTNDVDEIQAASYRSNLWSED